MLYAVLVPAIVRLPNFIFFMMTLLCMLAPCAQHSGFFGFTGKSFLQVIGQRRGLAVKLIRGRRGTTTLQSKITPNENKHKVE